MSQRRAIVDGLYQWLDEGEGRARVAGFGGRMVTDHAAPRRKPPNKLPTPERRARDRAWYQARKLRAELAGDPRPNTRRCDAAMPLAGEPCARFEGHGDTHRTRAALDYDAGTG